MGETINTPIDEVAQYRREIEVRDRISSLSVNGIHVIHVEVTRPKLTQRETMSLPHCQFNGNSKVGNSV